MAKKRPTVRKPARKTVPRSTPKPATLAVLVYLCGDNHIEKYTDEYLQRMLKFAPGKELHLVVQYDTKDAAKRYVVRAGEGTKREEKSIRRDVNTGDPKALEEFLEWGLKTVSAEHHVLILSGLGINPRYVRQSLPLESLPEALQEVRGGKPSDPNDKKYHRDFAKCVAELQQSDLAKYRDAIHQRLFSICHDFSNSGSLDICELRQVLLKAVEAFDETKQDPRFDLVLLDVGAAAFVEVLFELEGLAQVFVGSRDLLPDEGFPYTEILRRWDHLATEKPTGTERKKGKRPKPFAQQLAHEFLAAVRDRFGADNSSINGIIAANLDTLDEVARVLDALAIALLHSLGDWHVLDAILRAGQQLHGKYVQVNEPNKTHDTAAASRASRTKPEINEIDNVEFLPAVDLFELLDALETSFHEKLASGKVQVRFGQHRRIQELYRLIRKTVAHLHSRRLLARDEDEGSLLLWKKENVRARQGLSILLPPIRSPEEIQRGTGKCFSLSSASYSRLNFTRRVHWSALIGAIQLIVEKPHALWRVISSMLADASSPARDAALGRLMSKQSVISNMRGQFQSLGEAESLTMSLEPLESKRPNSDVSRFQVRLEPSLGGSVIYQQDSRVFKSSLEATLHELHVLLHESHSVETLCDRLRSLGASLGEDIIQDLVRALETERDSITDQSDETPHLTLQMPRSLMRFPWELMHDRQGMLCERYALGRQVFMESQLVRPVPRRVNEKIRVLVIGDPEYTLEFQQRMEKRGWRPAPLPSARQEATIVKQAFEQLHDEMAGIVEFQVTDMIGQRVSMNDMRRFLREGAFDIIHYAGHAFFDTDDADGSAWVLSDGLLHAREIRNTLAWAEAPPWLIFANACEAGMDRTSSTESIDGIDAANSLSAVVGDVSGLATACINQGVAAYIAPLWPVDDEIARWLAVGFYRQLLRERYSIGEALRRSRMIIWQDLQESGAAQAMPAKTALTWSSFVLYGDPTSRLLQSLWTPGTSESKQAEPAGRGGEGERTVKLAPLARRPFRQVTQGQLAEIIDLPEKLLQSPTSDEGTTRTVTTRGASAAAPTGVRLELAERNGVRFWRAISDDGEMGVRTFSPLGKLLEAHNETEADQRTRSALRSLVGSERGVMDFVNVVKSWLVKKVTGTASAPLITSLAAEFDRQQVPEEGLFRFVTSLDRRRVPTADERGKKSQVNEQAEWLDRNAVSGQVDRALLFVHGTFSKCEPTIQAIADGTAANGAGETESLFNWMLRHYRAVLGYDHWTLAKSPEENANDLLKRLPLTWSTAGKGSATQTSPLELDIVCHSRGGLVTRALIELLKPKIKIRRVIFVGVPNAGTNLANPANWGTMADVLVNLVSDDPTGLFGRLSGFLTYLLAQGIGDQVPGLQAMNPLTARPNTNSLADAAPFLARLQKPDEKSGTEYFVVASNYMPDRKSLSVLSILKETGDQLVDRFFANPNDLVVDTASMWAFDQLANWKAKVSSVSADNVLLFNTEREGPGGVTPHPEAGIHHVNYFTKRTVREFIRKTLEA